MVQTVHPALPPSLRHVEEVGGDLRVVFWNCAQIPPAIANHVGYLLRCNERTANLDRLATLIDHSQHETAPRVSHAPQALLPLLSQDFESKLLGALEPALQQHQRLQQDEHQQCHMVEFEFHRTPVRLSTQFVCVSSCDTSGG
eukprot:1029985-Rhodomonas_salina.1